MEVAVRRTTMAGKEKGMSRLTRLLGLFAFLVFLADPRAAYACPS